MIIQCPSCNTKFALDASLVDELDEPRFHCSRCDHVFNFEETSPSIKPLAKDARGSPSYSDSIPRGQTELPLESSTRVAHAEPGSTSRSLPIPSPGPSTRSVVAPHEQLLDEDRDDLSFNEVSEFDSFESDTGQPETAGADLADRAEPPSTFALAVEEEDIASTARLPEGSITPLIPPHLRETAQLSETSRSPSDEAVAPSNKTQASHGILENIEVPEPIHSSDLTFLNPTATPAPSNRRNHQGAGSSVGSEEIESYQSLVSQYRPIPRSNTSSLADTQRSWRSLLVVGTPIIGALIFLSLLAYTLRTHPELATQVSRIAFPAAPQVAPNDLFIKNAKFRKTLLDSGESVLVVSGKILNDSSSSFRDVIVEGILFDANGAPLLRTRASASSALAKGRLRSLSPEMIARTQAAPPESDYRLASGDSQEFTLVMNDGAPTDVIARARFFSARIYSVKY